MLREKLFASYGLVSDVDEDGDPISNKQLLQICLANARLMSKDGVPAEVHGCPSLFIGSIGSAYHLENLLAAGITHILCLSSVIRLKHPHHFQYLRVVMHDKVNFDCSSAVTEALEFIINAQRGGGRVLVHCYQGISRSATVVLAYLIQYEGLSLMNAIARLRLTRPQAAPNPGFLFYLRALERNASNERNDSSGICSIVKDASTVIPALEGEPQSSPVEAQVTGDLPIESGVIEDQTN